MSLFDKSFWFYPQDEDDDSGGRKLNGVGKKWFFFKFQSTIERDV